LLVDLKLSGRNVAVVGGGKVSYKKVSKFVKEQPKIKVFSKSFSAGMRRLYREGKVELVNLEVKDVEHFIKSLDPKPDLLIAATDDPLLNAELATKARTRGCMVYVVDNPELSDFTLPAIAEVDDVKIAISTSGKSPAMARLLRKRVEKLIKKEDLLQIRLQLEVREMLKRTIPYQKARKRIIYEILRNKRVSELLKEGRFDEALAEALNIVESHKSKTMGSPR